MGPERAASSKNRRLLARAGRVTTVGVLALFLALLVYGLVTKSPETGIDEGLARASPVTAPGFDLPVLQPGSLGRGLASRLAPALADRRVALRELGGRPVVVNFWASWCVPCREEAPLLERSWRVARREEVLFVGVNQQDITEDARAFMREFRISYLNVRDQGNGTAREWGVTGLPETFFVTAEGKVVAHVIGVLSPEQMREGLAAARSGRALGARGGGEQRPTR